MGMSRRQLWPRAGLWLLLLGPAFFLLYGAANQYAASLPASAVGNIAMSWERHIPLWPWSIVPYWSIDLLYGVSLFLCCSRAELNIHALRLLLVTVLSCACFVLLPLRFGVARPPLDGAFGQLFDWLTGFDQPFNQAPSLHISLLTVLWLRYWQHVPRAWHWLLHGWFVLIGLSVLTTWQHHFWDIPTGFALAILVCYLLPMPLHDSVQPASSEPGRAAQLAARYGVMGLLLLVLAMGGGWRWLLLWPALACVVVAAGYRWLGPRVLQKEAGYLRFPARVTLWPYRLVAHALHRFYQRRQPACSMVLDDVWVGAVSAASHPRFVAVLDLAAEYDRHALPGVAYHSLPLLDLLLPGPVVLQQAVSMLDAMRQQPGPVLVHCALGMTRSVAIVASWLVISGRVADIGQALSLLRLRCGAVMLTAAQQRLLTEMCAQRGQDA